MLSPRPFFWRKSCVADGVRGTCALYVNLFQDDTESQVIHAHDRRARLARWKDDSKKSQIKKGRSESFSLFQKIL